MFFSIWAYLKDLTNRGKTIIITTHYIEEARLANTVRFKTNVKCLHILIIQLAINVFR